MGRPTVDRTAVSLTALRYLVALADARHFGRAAAACNVAQATLSEQIAKLESVLGVPLVERTRSVQLTDAGVAAVDRARVVLRQVDELVGEVGASRTVLGGRFALGVIPTLGPYLLPRLLPALRRAYPALQLALHEAITDELLADVAEHRIDAALVALPMSRAGLAHRELFDEALHVLVPRAHPLAAQTTIRTTALAAERVLLLTEGHCLRDQALELCDLASADTHDVRATSLETLTRLVEAGLGVTIVPALALPKSTAVVARPLVGERSGAASSRKLGLVWRKSHPRRQDLVAFGDVVRALDLESTSDASRARRGR